MAKPKGYSNQQLFGILMLVLVAMVATVVIVTNQTPQSATGRATDTPSGTATTGECEPGDCKTDPSMSYVANNAFTSAAVTGGTDYIKQNGFSPVSSLAAPRKCDTLTFWKDVSGYFVDLATLEEVGCGSGQQMRASAYPNSSVTLSAYDQYTQLTASNNLSMAANQVKNVEYRWEGNAEQANMPFGGCVVVEYPADMSYAKPSGAGLSDAACEHKVTYQVSSTDNTYSVYQVPEGWDKEGTGEIKSFNVQYAAGSADPSGTAKLTFYPANYYVTEDGNFDLAVEEEMNDDTTKTFDSANSISIDIE